MYKLRKKLIIFAFYLLFGSSQGAMAYSFQALKKDFLEFDNSIKSTYNEVQKTFLGDILLKSSSFALATGLTFFALQKALSLIAQQKQTYTTHSIHAVNVSDVSFNDYIGVPEAAWMLVDQIKNREKYNKMKAGLTKGILLTGNPGTGKSFLARAIAGQAKCPFFALSATELQQPLHGGGPLIIRNLFEQARFAAAASASKTAIIFIDEIDAVGVRGAFLAGGTVVGVVETLLTEMDGFDDYPEISVVVLAATNNPHLLDAALKRPGRFDSIIEIKNPDFSARKAIIELYFKKYPCSMEINAEKLALVTHSLTPASIKTLFNEAARTAAFHNRNKIELKDMCKALFALNDSHLAKHKELCIGILLTLYPSQEWNMDEIKALPLCERSLEDIIEIVDDCYHRWHLPITMHLLESHPKNRVQV